MITITISKPVFYFLVVYFFVCNYPDIRQFVLDVWRLF